MKYGRVGCVSWAAWPRNAERIQPVIDRGPYSMDSFEDDQNPSGMITVVDR